MKVSFTVEGNPIGWQRTGYNKHTGAKYTQEKTRQHKQLIAWAYRKQAGTFRFPKGTYVDMRVIAYLPIPKSKSKKARQLMIEGKIRPTVKPDCDNILKLVADALNGIAYDDDKQIVTMSVMKRYGDTPHTEIYINEYHNE